MFFKNSLLLTLALICLIFLSACASSSAPAGIDAYIPREYQLAAGDKLKIAVFGEDRFDTDYQVSSAGELSFPLVGSIDVTGWSVSDVKTFLENSLAEGYLNDPRVSVEVVNYRPFFIFGEVSRPGKFDYDDNLTALQAVALAGGFTYRADQRSLFIRRSGQQQEHSYSLKDGRPIYVSPGDTIRIGERYF